MFTGIIEEVATIKEIEAHKLVVTASIVVSDLANGASIAVNGACLTVVALNANTFTVELSEETLSRTNLGSLNPGDSVNLERALEVGGRLGGHIVQGHVDGVGTLLDIGGPAERCTLRVGLPEALSRYVVEKGFVAVEGISLTVAISRELEFSVAVIPYTLAHTNLRSHVPGNKVNLELDILAKYVERLLPRG